MDRTFYDSTESKKGFSKGGEKSKLNTKVCPCNPFPPLILTTISQFLSADTSCFLLSALLLFILPFLKDHSRLRKKERKKKKRYKPKLLYTKSQKRLIVHLRSWAETILSCHTKDITLIISSFFFFFFLKCINILILWNINLQSMMPHMVQHSTTTLKFRAYLVDCNRHCNVIVIHMV